jgi:outer membrane putative beta-barrel porin/alpha-amylase
MSNRLLVPALLLSVVSTWPSLKAQSLCPAGVASDKLICVIPQVFGPNGLVLPTANVNLFQNSAFTSALRPLNSAIGRQSALLPLASPSSEIIFTQDPVSKLPVPAADSFGPILSERAETIGRHQPFLGFDYQYFKFDSLDGLDLKSLPVVLTQPDFVVSGTNCSIHAPDGPQNTGDCVLIRDTIKTSNRVNLKIHQYTTFVTFGLTSRLDVSMVIPIESVRMSVFSDATIVNNSNSLAHTFDIDGGVCGSFTPPTPRPTHSFSYARNANGVGDITLRVKGTAWKGEKAAVALGVDVRMPTGDAFNFTGAGAYVVKPFVFSPHAFLGYEVNGSSVNRRD